MAKFLNSTMAMIPIIVNPAIALSTYPSKKKNSIEVRLTKIYPEPVCLMDKSLNVKVICKL